MSILVQSNYEIMYPFNDEAWIFEAKMIETAGRISHKSENNITDESYNNFISKWNHHTAMIEFGNLVVKFVTDRGVSHELVRHRLMSPMQESSRYCNYSKDKFENKISVVEPSKLSLYGKEAFDIWFDAMEHAEKAYMKLTQELNVPPDVARSVLPTCTKTEIFVKADFTEWKHIFQKRAIEKYAHADIRKIMIPLYEECRRRLPCVFEMGDVDPV